MDKIESRVEEWKNSNIHVFWGELAPCEHLVQFYENDSQFLATLEGFAGCGILSGDSVVIVATPAHLEILHQRLLKQGMDLDKLQASNKYIAIAADEALSKFMVNDWPDKKLFNDFINQIIDQAKADGGKVRVFGEMVALLWEKGLNGATVQLEHLWHELQDKKSFTLYCAYPKSGFTQSANDSMETICKAHSKIIDGEFRPSTEIYYRAV